MSWDSKVLWTEGLFLQPHHFQQADRYTEALVGGLARRVAPALERSVALAQEQSVALAQEQHIVVTLWRAQLRIPTLAHN